MDLRQTKRYGDFLTRIGWVVEREPKSGVVAYVRSLPLTPLSVIKIQRPHQLPRTRWVEYLIKKYRAVQVNIEPMSDADVIQLASSHYHRQPIAFLPSATNLVDLRLPTVRLLSRMKQKTRYNLKMAERKGLRVEVVDGRQMMDDVQLFEQMFSMQKQNARRLGIFSLPKQWFRAQVEALGEDCFAVMASLNKQLVAATFYMVSDDTVYYSHNGSLPEGRKVFAPTVCAWAGMLEGKRRGKAMFDFEGVYDERSKVVRWQGFSRFKSGFGGQAVWYPGLYSRWRWRW